MARADQLSRRIKLRHLSALLAVVEHGSMAKAAQHLSVSQPVVSKAIADLEATLGVALLDRSTRGVEPTRFGRALLKRSTAVFDELRTSVSELENLADPTAGDLRVGSTPAMGSGLLPMIVDRMSRQYPKINFEITLAEPSILQRDLRARQIDLVMGQRATPETRTNDLAVTVLYRDNLNVVAARTNAWARRRKVSLADLVGERWCLPPPEHPISELMAAAFRRDGLAPPTAAVIVPSAPFTSNLLAEGQYLGVLGSVFFHTHGLRSKLQILPVKLVVADWPIGILTLKHRAMSPVTRLFIDYARGILPSLARAGGRTR